MRRVRGRVSTPVTSASTTGTPNNRTPTLHCQLITAQTSSRKTASQWLCYIHNLVNQRLEKEEFDCTKLDDTYDCGCGDDPSEKKEQLIKGG